MAIKKIYFVRHGETEGNAKRFFQFHDTPLTELGHKGAQAVAERFKNIQVHTLIASHFLRAQQTANYISELKNIPITTVDSFHESLRPTAYRGKSLDAPEVLKFRTEYGMNYWKEDWHEEGGENYFDVYKRVVECVDYLEKSISESIVVVSHGDFITAVVSHLLLNKNDDVEINKAVTTSLHRMSNVGITEFLFEDGIWKLFTWNDNVHFAE